MVLRTHLHGWPCPCLGNFEYSSSPVRRPRFDRFNSRYFRACRSSSISSHPSIHFCPPSWVCWFCARTPQNVAPFIALPGQDVNGDVVVVGRRWTMMSLGYTHILIGQGKTRGGGSSCPSPPCRQSFESILAGFYPKFIITRCANKSIRFFSAIFPGQALSVARSLAAASKEEIGGSLSAIAHRISWKLWQRRRWWWWRVGWVKPLHYIHCVAIVVGINSDSERPPPEMGNRSSVPEGGGAVWRREPVAEKEVNLHTIRRPRGFMDANVEHKFLFN